MNEQIRDMLKEKALDFAESIGAPLEIHEHQYYVHAATIRNYLGFNKSNISRPFRDHYDLGKQGQRGHWYVRVDFIPWWLIRLVSGHNLSYEVVENIRGILREKFGIPTPKPQWYIYFYEVEETRNIKIGLTSNYISGTRKPQLKKRMVKVVIWVLLKILQTKKKKDFKKGLPICVLMLTRQKSCSVRVGLYSVI